MKIKWEDRAPQTVLQNYEPVYNQPNKTQTGKPTGKQPVFDDEACAVYIYKLLKVQLHE